MVKLNVVMVYMFIWWCLLIIVYIKVHFYWLHHILRYGSDIGNSPFTIYHQIFLGIKTHLICLSPKKSAVIIVIWKPVSDFILFLLVFLLEEIHVTIRHLSIYLHVLITMALAWGALVATRACAPLKLFDFKYLLSFWCTLRFRIINFVQATLVVKNLFHLFFWDKSAMVPESIFGQIFSARVPNVISIHPGLLFLPVLEDSRSPFLSAKAWPVDGAGTVTALTPAAPWWHWLVHSIGWHWPISGALFQVKIKTITLTMIRAINRNVG